MKIKSFVSFNEAKRAPVDTVRASLKADPATAPLLSKTARVDPDGAFASLADPAATLAAVKRILLNNQDVIEYVRARRDVVVSKYVFDMLRAMRTPDDLHKWIDSLAQFISDLLGDAKRTESGAVTTDTKHELQDWANSEFSRGLSRSAAAELASNPSLKPDGPVRLYRGILFNSIGETYDGKLTNGAKFLKQVRAGERTVDMEWDLPSSWTYSLDTAENFATIKAASSQAAATMDWLYRSRDKRAIDGELGVIVSVLARPDDVIVDMDRIRNPMSRVHGSEAEVIVAPGKYLCRIVKMWNKNGEVDPVKYTSGKADDALIDTAELMIGLAADVLPIVHDLIGEKMWPYDTAVAGAIYSTDEPNPARIASGLSAWDKTAAAADRVLDLLKSSGILDKELPKVEDPRLTSIQNRAIRAVVETRVFNMAGKYAGDAPKRLLDYENADEAMRAINARFTSAMLNEGFSKYFKRMGLIKMSIDRYSREKVDAIMSKYYADLSVATGRDVSDDAGFRAVWKDAIAVGRMQLRLIKLAEALSKIKMTDNDN